MLVKHAHRSGRRKINALLYVTQKIGPEVLPHLLQNHNLNLRVICDIPKTEFQELLQDGTDISRVPWVENVPQDPYRNETEMKGHRLAQWADLLFVIADASMMALMLGGFTTDIIMHTLRCWDTSKRIVMLPEMSREQYRHPIWKRQLCKLQRKWMWVNVLDPAIYHFSSVKESFEDELDLDEDFEVVWEWDGVGEIFEIIYSEAQSALQQSTAPAKSLLRPNSASQSHTTLPSEIWSLVLDHLGDWELATALGIYTYLPVPPDWEKLVPTPGSKTYSLEYTILTQPMSEVKAFFTSMNSLRQSTNFSDVAVRLTYRFALTELLTYLALHQKDIFWTSFGLAQIPHKASVFYNSPTILTWWQNCPAMIKKEYGAEAIDGASRAGFVEVLDWWLHSGLNMSYTEKALESASAKGHVKVLQWWRVNSMDRAGTSRELPLKVGKSILLAAQSGCTESIEWWEASGIPYSNEDGVARLASVNGHVEVLELWHKFKGSKMIFDNQVLVGATKNGHRKVLEWWKQASRKWGLKVEYKTCDIEEAMEDAIGGGGEGEVRDWWSLNGLNLGVGTGEWMRVKTL